MSSLLIEGGRRLSGTVAVGGNKNSALPLIAACLLTEDQCVLTNVPRIGDVGVMAQLLVDLGASVEGMGTSTLRIRCPRLERDEPQSRLVGRLRGSVLLLGPMLARRGRAHLAPPGGDFPARRTIAMHLAALKAMGARELEGEGHLLEAPEGLVGASMYLEEASVTGTETARPRRGRGKRHDRDPARRLRASRRRAVPVPAQDGGWRVGGGHPDNPHRGRPAPGRRHARTGGRLHRGRQLGGRRGGHRRLDRHRLARARRTWK